MPSAARRCGKLSATTDTAQGHGVGYFLNVHEPPQRISYFAPNTPEYALRQGMLTSNEPALYRPNQWGIRIESLVVAQPVAQPQETQFGDYLCLNGNALPD